MSCLDHVIYFFPCNFGQVHTSPSLLTLRFVIIRNGRLVRLFSGEPFQSCTLWFRTDADALKRLLYARNRHDTGDNRRDQGAHASQRQIEPSDARRRENIKRPAVRKTTDPSTLRKAP